MNRPVFHDEGLTGQEIKEIRKKARLTQEEFGACLGMSKRQVWSLEHNERNNPAVSELILHAELVRPRKQYGISGAQVARIRKKKGLSQAEFGRRLGLTKRQIWSIEHREMNSGACREKVKAMKKPEEGVSLSGEQLKQIRSLTGLSQSKFARTIGLCQSTYNYLEHKDRTSPEIAEKIQGAFPSEFKETLTLLKEQITKVQSPEPLSVGLKAAQVKDIRVSTGLTQAGFAAELHLTQPAVSDLEHYGCFSPQMEQRVAERFPKEYYRVTSRFGYDMPEALTGKEVRQIRQLAGLLQSSFAERLGVSQPGVNNAEHREAASLKLTAKIRAAFPKEYEAALQASGRSGPETEPVITSILKMDEEIGQLLGNDRKENGRREQSSHEITLMES